MKSGCSKNVFIVCRMQQNWRKKFIFVAASGGKVTDCKFFRCLEMEFLNDKKRYCCPVKLFQTK